MLDGSFEWRSPGFIARVPARGRGARSLALPSYRQCRVPGREEHSASGLTKRKQGEGFETQGWEGSVHTCMNSVAA